MLTRNDLDSAAIETLKHIFHDRPELLDIVTIQGIQSERMLENQRVNEFFATHIQPLRRGEDARREDRVS